MMCVRFALLAAVVMFGAAIPASAAGPTPGVNVVVTNPSSAPVPVTLSGTSSISGNVTVTNLPAIQKTRDVLSPGQSPITLTARFNPSTVFDQTVTPTVPAGQRFILTYVSEVGVSGNSAFPVTAGSCNLRFGDGRFLAAYALASTSLDISWMSENMFVVLNAGDSISTHCELVTGAPASQIVDATVSGYFVPLP